MKSTFTWAMSYKWISGFCINTFICTDKIVSLSLNKFQKLSLFFKTDKEAFAYDNMGIDRKFFMNFLLESIHYNFNKLVNLNSELTLI